jgi:beta-lactam-binding protein with PASTA domain
LIRGKIGLNVKKLIVIGSGAIGALALSTLLGGGVAAADDYAGQTYSDASSAASDAGATVVVAARVGDKVDEGDCIVTRSQNAPFATATKPGPSLGSPEGAAAKAAADEKAAEEKAAADQSAEAELADAGQAPGEAGQVAGG